MLEAIVRHLKDSSNSITEPLVDQICHLAAVDILYPCGNRFHRPVVEHMGNKLARIFPQYDKTPVFRKDRVTAKKKFDNAFTKKVASHPPRTLAITCVCILRLPLRSKTSLPPIQRHLTSCCPNRTISLHRQNQTLQYSMNDPPMSRGALV